eukprot:SAG31_NODE_3565_length_4119_cov_108.823383_4_plen_269_part_00
MFDDKPDPARAATFEESGARDSQGTEISSVGWASIAKRGNTSPTKATIRRSNSSGSRGSLTEPAARLIRKSTYLGGGGWAGACERSLGSSTYSENSDAFVDTSGSGVLYEHSARVDTSRDDHVASQAKTATLGERRSDWTALASAIFRLSDLDSDGRLSLAEFELAARSLSPSLSAALELSAPHLPEEAKLPPHLRDAPRPASLGSFSRVVTAPKQGATKLWRLFDRFDLDKSGTIDKPELAGMIATIRAAQAGKLQCRNLQILLLCS